MTSPLEGGLPFDVLCIESTGTGIGCLVRDETTGDGAELQAVGQHIDNPLIHCNRRSRRILVEVEAVQLVKRSLRSLPLEEAETVVERSPDRIGCSHQVEGRREVRKSRLGPVNDGDCDGGCGDGYDVDGDAPWQVVKQQVPSQTTRNLERVFKLANCAGGKSRKIRVTGSF